MRKVLAVVAGGLMVLGLLALMPAPANAELKVAVTGNVRLNVVYSDVIANNGASQENLPTGVPYTAGPGKNRETDNAQTMIDARRTRIQVAVSDDVGMTKLTAFIQTDFDTGEGTAVNSNSRGLRIRLAWAQGQTPTGWILRFGQQRTMLSEIGDNLFGGVGSPDLVDETGNWDQFSGRQPGVWLGWTTKTMGGDLLVGVGMEKASTSVKTTPAASTAGLASTATVDPAQGTGEDVPLFGAAARFRTPLWAVFVRGGTQKNNVIQTGPKDGNNTAYQGWVGAITAEVTPGPLTIYGQYWYGDGLNRLGYNFQDVAMGQTVASNSATGFAGPTGGKANAVNHLKAIQTHNWHAGAEYKLTKDLKTTVVYEWDSAVPNRRIFDLTAASVDKAKFQTVHAGFGYTFWSRFNFGLEYQWAQVHSFGSSVGNMNAVNSRLHFYF